MTLPVIHALRKSSGQDRRKAIDIIKNHSDKTEKVSWVVDLVIQSGGLEYAQQKMLEIRNRSLDMIAQLKPSDAQNSLKELVLFTTERAK
jgi:octaprenyl-diphosphate synthase